MKMQQVVIQHGRDVVLHLTCPSPHSPLEGRTLPGRLLPTAVTSVGNWALQGVECVSFQPQQSQIGLRREEVL